jgi:dinuclear metal center YbgI/SA1388 family protein
MKDKMQTTDLHTIVKKLDLLLAPERFSDADIAWNGLQVEAGKNEIQKVGLAVDAGLSILRRAVEEECQLLVTHHGLFWGSESPIISGIKAQKIRTLLLGGCSLYSSHLPLDGHIEVGNAAQLAQHLGLTNIRPGFLIDGISVGVFGEFPETMKRDDLPAFVYEGTIPRGQDGITCSLLFGKEDIRTVGIATGSASSLISHAKLEGCDLMISGEPKHEAYHLAQEEELNVLFAGHYFTETFGVKALGEYLKKELHVSTVFFDEPTGI